MNSINVKIAKCLDHQIPEIEMEFLNGSVTIPGRRGAYVVATGCGAGKTTAIRQLILSEYRKGIVYSAATIRECNEMYDFLVNSGINKNAIIVLHSDTEKEGVDLNTLRNHPEDIANKSIVICTHHKLLNEYPEAFLRFNKNVVVKSMLSHLSRGYYKWDQNGMCKLPRQYILIDEMPTCKSFSFRITDKTMAMLSIPDTITVYPDPNDPEHTSPYQVMKIPEHYSNGGNYSLMENISERFNIKLVSKDQNTELSRLKNDLALSMVYESHDRLLDIFSDPSSLPRNEDNDPYIEMTYTIADQVEVMPEDCRTRFLLFDGTGDLTFIPRPIGYSPFKVLTYPNKYNSLIGVCKVDMGYKRSYRTETELHSLLPSILDNIRIQLDRINELTKQGRRVLIVTWKNLKVGKEGVPHGIPIEQNDIREVEYIDYLKGYLNQKGNIEGTNYSIIHYQSGLDKATNEFRDYDTIYFLGEFHVPDYVINKFNRDYRVCTSVENYTLYQLVQAVCRTRIRNHKGQSIDIYFTSDWDKRDGNIIDSLVRYLLDNKIAEVRDTTLSKIKPKWRPAVRKLCSLSEEARSAIELSKGCSFSFTLDEFYDLMKDEIPVSRKEVGRYLPFINYVRKKGIEVNLTGGAKNQYMVR